MSPSAGVRGRNDLWGGLLLAIGCVLGLTALAGVSLFAVAATGFFTWLAIARKQGWAWIPAAIFGISVVSDILDGVGGSLFFPLMVIAAGVLLLARDRLSRRATFGILLLLLVVGISSGSRDDDPPIVVRDPEAPAAPPALEERTGVEVPELEGRDLVILSDATPVALRVGGGRSARVTDDDTGFSIAEDDDLVTISVEDSADSLSLEIPRESNVIVRTVSGSVTADVVGFGLDVDTVSGKVDIEIGGSFDPPVRARSERGDIDVEDFEDTDPSARVFAGAGRQGQAVEVRTRSGDIEISKD